MKVFLWRLGLLVLCGNLSGCLYCVFDCTPTPIKPYLRHLEKPGVTDEQRREDCRACGASCHVRYPPHVIFPLKKPPNFCWSNPEHPELCTDALDSMPGFPNGVLRAAALPGEDPDELPGGDPSKASKKAWRDYHAIKARLIEKWKACMFDKGYAWNPSDK